MTSSAEKPVAKFITDQLEVPELDERRYRVFTLNQMEVLLTQDAKTEKAGAAIDVDVGYFSDPEKLPGAFHLLEHMFFLGTKKV